MPIMAEDKAREDEAAEGSGAPSNNISDGLALFVTLAFMHMSAPC